MTKIGIIGSRSRHTQLDFHKINQVLKEIYKEGDIIISGGCYKGADAFAEVIAKRDSIPILIYYANWDKHGRIAGFMRNTNIAQDSDVLIACPSADRTGGTEDTIKKYLKLGKDKLILV